MVNEASLIKRQRASKNEMEKRYAALVRLAHEHGPCSVRHLYYRAVVENLVEKTDSWTDDPDQTRVILYIGDHDPAGLEIERALIEKIDRFNEDHVDYDFRRIAVTWDQVVAGQLPGSKPKKDYAYPLAVEAEALPPNDLRRLVDVEIEQYVDPHQLHVLQVAENSEREIAGRLVELLRGDAA